MPTRRRLLLTGASALLAAACPSRAQDGLGGIRGSLDAAAEGLVPGASLDQSPQLRRALARAEAEGLPLFLPPGRYYVGEISLPGRAHLIGVPGRTTLAFSGGRFMLRAEHAASLRLDGLTLDGLGLPLDPEAGGLLRAEDVAEVVIAGCRITGSAAAAVSLRGCAGRIEDSEFREAATIGLNLDQSRGMRVSGNQVADCGSTGILVQRDEEGPDDTIVTGNRVSGIRADPGGTGQYGNGINLDKAAGVIVSDNRIDNCDFSAIRCYSADNVQLTGNVATRSGEMAIYVEFASQGAVVANNLVDGAGFGISFANFMEHEGRLAVCSGNLVRNISGISRLPRGAPMVGTGIGAEADAAISGNVIENAPRGLQLGWGPYLRNVAASGNVIRGCRTGIGVSVVEGSGPALISGNLIAGATEGAILGMRWDEVATGDLAQGGAEAVPHLTLVGNRVS